MLKYENPFSKTIESKQHSPVYKMHRYFARRPHNVFSELIKHYTKEGNIILDPFCGGGVTVVEGLLLNRKVIGIDVNPLATFVTEMEVFPLNVDEFKRELNLLEQRVRERMNYLYKSICPECLISPSLHNLDSESFLDWIEWENGDIIRCKYKCSEGHSGEKYPDKNDIILAQEIENNFEEMITREQLCFPQQQIPDGDKTKSIIRKGYDHFWQLFTKRNLTALSVLKREISNVENLEIRKFLLFALSGALKWASKQSHLRGDVVEGWAMHAYWIYPRSLEINVWETFIKRCKAIISGKESIKSLNHYKATTSFDNMLKDANVMIISQSSDDLPLPDKSVDAIITDPPYGGNVNYGELADYWLVWLDDIMDKTKEAVINTTQGKNLKDYEELLLGVFKECNRVLEDESPLVATFNSKDLVIISSFVKSVVKAGFRLMDGGLLYQPPIKAYVTTVHAKEVGAFTGDFIFTFCKDNSLSECINIDVENCKILIDEIIEKHAMTAKTEVQMRRWIYEEVIPLFAEWAKNPDGWITDIAKYAESQLKKKKFESLHFERARSIAV
jgi:putative DNA methylase